MPVVQSQHIPTRHIPAVDKSTSLVTLGIRAQKTKHLITQFNEHDSKEITPKNRRKIIRNKKVRELTLVT